jgi:hypothetical protein
VGSDGKTAYERLKGKTAGLPGLQFGERILWKSNVPSYRRKDKMESDWTEGIFLGQRTVSGEYLVGSKECIFRPRTVRRVPLAERWVDNLAFALYLQWKHNSRQEAGDQVLLAEEPPTPSLVPESTPLPPRSSDDPSMKDVRQFYVKPRDLDPAGNGIGFTDGCKGCRSIIYNVYPRQSHDNRCRHRVIKAAATNADIASRVKTTIDKDVAWHAMKLEASETRQKGQLDEKESVEDPAVPAPFEENMASTQSSSSQGQQVPTRGQQIPKVKTKFAGKMESPAHLSMRKKHEERNAVVDAGGQSLRLTQRLLHPRWLRPEGSKRQCLSYHLGGLSASVRGLREMGMKAGVRGCDPQEVRRRGKLRRNRSRITHKRKSPRRSMVLKRITMWH